MPLKRLPQLRFFDFKINCFARSSNAAAPFVKDTPRSSLIVSSGPFTEICMSFWLLVATKINGFYSGKTCLRIPEAGQKISGAALCSPEKRQIFFPGFARKSYFFFPFCQFFFRSVTMGSGRFFRSEEHRCLLYAVRSVWTRLFQGLFCCC